MLITLTIFHCNIFTKQSAAPNLICKQVVILTALPFDNQSYIFGLLSHTNILILSICCRILRKAIRNYNILWKKVYEHKFLSDGQYDIEYEFIFRCARTKSKRPNVPVRRMDLLKNIDWHIYRRRIITENNWRNGYSNTTYIELELDQYINLYRLDSYPYSDSTSGAIIKNTVKGRTVYSQMFSVSKSWHTWILNNMAAKHNVSLYPQYLIWLY
jgi:hypothetical protein